MKSGIVFWDNFVDIRNTYRIANIGVHGDQDRVSNKEESPESQFQIILYLALLSRLYSVFWSHIVLFSLLYVTLLFYIYCILLLCILLTVLSGSVYSNMSLSTLCTV